MVKEMSSHIANLIPTHIIFNVILSQIKTKDLWLEFHSVQFKPNEVKTQKHWTRSPFNGKEKQTAEIKKVTLASIIVYKTERQYQALSILNRKAKRRQLFAANLRQWVC